MIVNISCPSCGGQATEYDANRWACLHCGNKFIYAPASPPQIHNYVQNTVNVVGQPTYELDVQNAKPAKPILKTRFEHSPEQFQYLPAPDKILDSIRVSNATIYPYSSHAPEILEQYASGEKLQLCFGILIPIFALATIIAAISKSLWMLLFGAGTLFCILHLFVNLRVTIKLAPSLKEIELLKRQREQEVVEGEQRKKEEIIVGYQPICPFCMADVADPSSGLTHCLKCGKQFHYSNKRSYPAIFK
jgi:ribosomal protein L37AE/L43A